MKVFLAIPSYHGIKCLPFLDSLEATIKLLMARGHEPFFAKQEGCCYVQVARNELVHSFMAPEFDDYDSLFFLDDDVSWEPEDALKLVEMADDMVAGIYPKKTEVEDYPVVIKADANDRPIVRADGALAALMVPTGFLCIKRHVFQKLYEAFPQQQFVKPGESEIHYDLFPQGVQHRRWWGDDFAFCRLWNQIDGQIWVVPNITFGHHGDKTYTGNYHEFLLRQPGGSKAA